MLFRNAALVLAAVAAVQATMVTPPSVVKTSIPLGADIGALYPVPVPGPDVRALAMRAAPRQA